MTAHFSVVGKKVPDVVAKERVTGACDYAVDLQKKGMLIARVLRSPLPHARIIDFDLSKAEKLPGVKAIITYKDVPSKPYQGFNQLILDSTVRFVGEEVAAIAADTEETADAALQLMKVVYKPLPYVTDPEEALKPDAPRIHPGGNVQINITRLKGDVEKGFGESDGIFERRYHVPTQVIASLRQIACLAEWTRRDKLTIWVSTQAIFVRREELAQLLDIPVGNVRVISHYEGGGFGEENKHRYVELAAILARKTGRPVKILLPHDYSFEATPRKRHPAILDVKIGYKTDGTIISMLVRALFNSGAYLAGGQWVPDVSRASLFYGYRIPNMRFDAKAVFTNIPPFGAYRGFGAPQSNFAVQSAFDDLADLLGMDPTEVQLKNVIRPDDKIELPRRGGAPSLFVDMTKVGGSCLIDAIEKGREMIGWQVRKRGGIVGEREQDKRGIGCALLAYQFGTPQRLEAKATVRIDTSGKVHIKLGIADFGGGQRTVQAIIAAERLGVRLEDVNVSVGDSSLPQSVYSIASRTTVVAGSATDIAAKDAKEKLLKSASTILKVPKESLHVKESKIMVGSGKKVVPLVGLMAKVGKAIEGKGSYTPNPLDGESGFQLGSCFADVNVNVWTGKVTVERLAIVQDFGRVLNPLAAKGQMIGGAIQSLGYGLLEDYVIEATTNQAVTRTWLDYHVPSFLDAPEIKTHFIENPDPRYPFGAKGGGESMIVCTHSAIRNAIANAIGVRFDRIPITPKMILESLKAKEGVS